MMMRPLESVAPDAVAMDDWIFKTDRNQRAQLRTILRVSEDKFALIASRVDTAIGEFRYFDATNQYDRPAVKDMLSQVSEQSEQLSQLLDQVLFLLADDEPSYHFASRLIHLNHPAKGDDAEQQTAFLNLIKDLRDMKVAADQSLENPHLKSKTKKNVRETYVPFIRELKTAYTVATGRQPGRGSTTRFCRFVKTCFELADHPLKDPVSEIYRVLGPAKK